jgi:amino acid transporter/nucleotide-binding universal stress UspA family protein
MSSDGITGQPSQSPSPSASEAVTKPGTSQRLARAAQVIVVGSVMFTFISYWRTAAVVLCDLASTAYYIGGIVEQAIGPAAPWFILAVMIFSYAVRAVYIESCSMFLRGGVYRVVREALGSFAAKLAVSALIFDYVLTGPISTVSAGQYIMGLLLDSLKHGGIDMSGLADPEPIKRWGSVVIACATTFYFWWQNVKGIHESSDKAMKIMIATTIMGVIVLAWCGTTLAIQGPAQASIPATPDLNPKVDVEGKALIDKWTGHQVDPLGFLPFILPASWVETIRHPAQWLSLIGLIGLFIAFGHSILAMSGEETLAQVYREVESPKLPNFKKAAFIVFIYSLALTGTISFMAVLLIPDNVRMRDYSDNLIGGLAMYLIGPAWVRLLLNAFVTIIGFAILSGACNTSIIGANGVLNRVAEDGILPDFVRKPHPRYGTTHRILILILVLQLFTIIASQGEVFLLGEAYAFGVVWSFVFQAFSMVVLRFKDPRPREFKVPLNIRVGQKELPIGLSIIFLILLISAIMNFFTKEVATVGGLIFTTVLFALFTITERVYQARTRGRPHGHLEQFNPASAEEVTPASLGLTKPYRKLVAIRSPQNLHMLEKALAETDPDTTDVVVMTAKHIPTGGGMKTHPDDLDRYDQELMTAVVNVAEKAGKEVHPLIVPTNNPLHAVIRTAKELQAQELIMGASNIYTADEQLEQIGFYWINLHQGQTAPLTVHILSRQRDMYLDLGGGNRIPKISERKARSVAELRAAGVGVDRVLLVYDGSAGGSDLFQAVLTMLDPQVALTVVPLVPRGTEPHNGHHLVKQDQERAKQLDRELEVFSVDGDPGVKIVDLARDKEYDLIILYLPEEMPSGKSMPLPPWADYILRHAHCQVFIAPAPLIPPEIIDVPKQAAT